MSEITESVMATFLAELQKEAALPQAVQQVARHLGRRGTRQAMQAGVGTGFGIGGLAGAGIGAVGGGISGYRQAREQGATVGQALGAGLGGAASGTLKGAVTGAAVGAGAGALGGAARPLETLRASKALAGRAGAPGAAARFGQRQVHGFTGFTPGGSKASIEKIRGGAYDARRAVEGSQAALAAGPERSGAGRLLDKALGRTPEQSKDIAVGAAQKELQRSQRWLQAAEDAQDMGLTSLPGIAKSMKTHGVGKTLKAGLSEQWHSAGPGTRALMFGFPAVAAGGAALTPTQEGGPGRAERVGRALGTIGYTAAPLTLGASSVLGMGLERAGGLIGKGVDALSTKTSSIEPGEKGFYKERKPTLPRRTEEPVAHELVDTGRVAVQRILGPGMTGQPRDEAVVGT